jgi:hypothetical protein
MEGIPMRANLAAIVVCLLSAATALAAEPRQASKQRPANRNGRDTQISLVRPLAFGAELWPVEASEEDDFQLVPPKQVFGPPANEPRKTLFQWSYGTSFEGGIDLEEDALETDRPDFVEASTTVGKGVLQIESGYTYIRNDDADDNSITHSAGEFLFRYGVYEDWLELRLGVFPFSQSVGSPAPSTTHSGLDDLYVGAKIALTPQEGFWPEMALVPQMTVPTGHNAVTANKWLPGINWLYGWDVTDFIAIGASTQFNSAVDDESNRKYTEWAQAITINYNLADNVGAYTEWFAFFPTGAESAQVEHYIDGGITYRPNPDMQFDVRAGLGLTGASDVYFVGTGFTIRIK